MKLSQARSEVPAELIAAAQLGGLLMVKMNYQPALCNRHFIATSGRVFGWVDSFSPVIWRLALFIFFVLLQRLLQRSSCLDNVFLNPCTMLLHGQYRISQVCRFFATHIGTMAMRRERRKFCSS